MPLLMKSAVGTMLAADSMPNASSVSIGLWLPYGSRNEKPQNRGFFHFIEHMVFKGTINKNAKELARTFERTGGFVNAFTERSATCFHCTIPAKEWEYACTTLLEMAFLSIFPEDEFEKEKIVILSEILQTEDDPEELAHEHFFRLFWKDQPIGLPIAGEPADIQTISREKLFSFYLEQFKPETSFISIAGAIDENKAARYIEDELARITSLKQKLFGTIGLPAENCGIIEPASAKAHIFSAYEKNHASLSYVIQCMQVPPPQNMRRYLLNALTNEIIGGSTISRLFQSLREKEGLCYTIFSSFETETLEALWIIHLQTGGKQLARALDVLDDEVDRLSKGCPSTIEFEDARSRLAGLLQLASEDTDFRQRRMARSYFAHGTADGIEQELALVQSIGYDEVCSAASDFGSLNRARFVFGAAKEKELLKRGYLEHE